MAENLLANRHGEDSKMKGRTLLKFKIPAETDSDASNFPKTVFEVSQKINKQTNQQQNKKTSKTQSSAEFPRCS